MDKIQYSVLIRTFNSEQTLPFTLGSLRSQTNPPSEYVFVDSGSTDNTLQLFPNFSKIHHYIGSEFNYSESLNQGLQYVSTEYVLIISSHTSLAKYNAIEFALTLLSSDDKIGAVYFYDENSGILRYELIDKRNFDGFNGLWNTCSIIKVPLLRKRGFRPEVFIAEDQEWARWLFYFEEKAIARISGAEMINRNPRQKLLKKQLNEYVSVAYFSNRNLLGWFNIARIAFNSIKLHPSLTLKRRCFFLALFFRLLACHFAKPEYRSRYF